MTDLALERVLDFEKPARRTGVSVRPPSPGLGFTFSGVEKQFGSKHVLKGIDLHVEAGQFLAIVGKSGCGKSTLLRLLAGLDRATGGDLRYDDAAAGNTTRIMFQEPRLLPWARVLDNVAIGLTGIASGAEARRRSLRLLEDVGLADRAGDWPSVLSGGQRQRVALARALVGQPRILALDEPLGALDALTRIEMQDLLERIWQHQRFTAVLVTHDVSEAVALADRVVVIKDGAIAADIAIDEPRPRRRGAAELARIEGKILEDLLERQSSGPSRTAA